MEVLQLPNEVVLHVYDLEVAAENAEHLDLLDVLRPAE